MKDVGFIIQNHLELKNMTQAKLGKEVGLSQKAISKYITGKSLPPLDVLDKICRTLEIEPSLFFTSSSIKKIYIQNVDEQNLILFYRKLSPGSKKAFINMTKTLDGNMK